MPKFPARTSVSAELGMHRRCVVAGSRFAGHSLVGQSQRHAVVDCVHHAADRLAAVAQRRRAAHDLDALGRERIDRDAVIGPNSETSKLPMPSRPRSGWNRSRG